MIRAYPAHPSVIAGDTLRLHVSTDAVCFRIAFVRVGARDECVAGYGACHAGEHARGAEAGVPWDWPAYDVPVPAHWQNGAYIAMLETAASAEFCDGPFDARSARALFTVRQSRANAPLLIVLPIFTYHAYNVAEVDGTLGRGQGQCLYSGSRWVSIHRPGGGVGGHPWDEVNADVYDAASPRQTFAHWDAKGLAWLESRGYRFDCVTDLELHDESFDLTPYRAIASFGHHEYWTARMRDRIDRFVATGGNVAFFGGNTCWFEVEYDEAARAIRRAGRWTRVPEWKTTGVSYAFGGGKWIGARPPAGFLVRDARHWIYDGLSLRQGDCFGFDERLIGYECDGAPPDSDLDLLADAFIGGWPVGDGSGEISNTARAALGIRGNKGAIFTASTVDWARVLHAGHPVVERITANVLDRFGAGA